MTPKQARFVAEYVAEPHGTKAATRAGYGAKSAHVTASRLLQNAEIRAAIATAGAKTGAALALDAERVLRGLLDIAENTEASQSARVQAWGLLGKHLGMFIDRMAHSIDQRQVQEMIERIAAAHGVSSDGLLEAAEKIASQQWEAAR